MTVSEKREVLRSKYISWFMDINNLSTDEDAKYTWWEREKDCQRWCSKEGTYVPMSDSDTLKIMRTWFKEYRKA